MTVQGAVLIGCIAILVLIVAIGVRFHRAYNRPITSKSKPESR